MWNAMSKLEQMIKYCPDPSRPFSGLGGMPDFATGYAQGISGGGALGGNLGMGGIGGAPPLGGTLGSDLFIEPYQRGMSFGENLSLYGNRNTAIIEFNDTPGLQMHHHNMGGGSLNYGNERISYLNPSDSRRITDRDIGEINYAMKPFLR